MEGKGGKERHKRARYSITAPNSQDCRGDVAYLQAAAGGKIELNISGRVVAVAVADGIANHVGWRH